MNSSEAAFSEGNRNKLPMAARVSAGIDFQLTMSALNEREKASSFGRSDNVLDSVDLVCIIQDLPLPQPKSSSLSSPIRSSRM